MSKKYIIDEDTLRALLVDSHTINILERDGVDNWWGWMESADDHLIECASMLPWNKDKSYDDLREMVVGEDYTIDDLVDDQINAFWEEYDNHRLVDDDE
jgi:hypothetical protein